MSPDVVVIGAGPNGLTAAAFLARAGRRVLVLERREAAAADAVDWDTGWVPPAVARGLALERHGWTPEHPDPWLTIPLDRGATLELRRDVRATADAIRRISPADGARWPEFCERMARLAGFLERLYSEPPPDPMAPAVQDAVQLLRLGLRARGLGRQGITDLLRTLPMPVSDLVDDWFMSDPLKGALAAIGVTGIRQGPRAAGTSFVLLHHHAGCAPGVFHHASRGLRRALAAAARAAGAEIRYGAEVARVLGPAERVTGVALGGGEEIAAPLVLSSADPKRTLLGLVDAACLTPEFRHAVENIKFRGARAVVELRVAQPPPFAALTVAPDVDYVDRAHDAAKYGTVSAAPVVDARALGPAPGGGHRLVAFAQYAPHALRDGPWDDARRRALGDAVLAALRDRVPALTGATVERVRTPQDLELEFGATEGQLYQGELTLDQILFMRPVPGWGRYATPVAGLYLCGSGTHPGGGIPGGAGMLAARSVKR